MDYAQFNESCLTTVSASIAQGALLIRLREVHEMAEQMFDARNGESRITDICEWLKARDRFTIFTIPGCAQHARVGANRQLVVGTFVTAFHCEMDNEQLEIPSVWIYSQPHEVRAMLSAELDKLYAEFDAHQAKEARKEEADLRALYERLKERFEPQKP